MNNYEPLEAVGSGSFGIIRKVRRKEDGKMLARKEIDYRKMSEKEKKQLVAEVNILRELRHPNIVRYYERFVDRQNCLIFIIMEYCEGGDLAAVIKRCKKEGRFIPEEIVWNLLGQLLLALQECHASDKHPTILHRDIKPDNVFLDKLLNVKLGDFGLSRVIENPEVDFAKTYVGTPFYMSPELVDESRYNAKSDIWALGCLIYELCALEPPFQANTQAALSAKIKSGKLLPLSSIYSQELQAIIRTMLTTKHELRPETTELLAHGHIRLSIREQDLSNSIANLNRREEEFEFRLLNLQERERLVAQREAELDLLAISSLTGRTRQSLSVVARSESNENISLAHKPMSKPSIALNTNHPTLKLESKNESLLPPNTNTQCTTLKCSAVSPSLKKTSRYTDMPARNTTHSLNQASNPFQKTATDDGRVPVMAPSQRFSNTAIKNYTNTRTNAMYSPSSDRLRGRVNTLRSQDMPIS
ncbi:hypothetical protein QVD99_006317 [Batrachochytrium dendrobatidis]|nr:hypothetical protein O5D80_003338 [Batrachochytrium dendrobatidis]KAK5667104.1 hypothetical protein QVD99_006317 [Batrachochytrium dendrobatidis]